MSEFFSLIQNQEFIRNAILAGFISSIVAGIIGTFVVIKRISLVTGGIAHAVLAGVGISYFLSFSTLIGALIFAILAAVIIGISSIYFKEREDTIISSIWSIGMALGIIFMFLTPGYNTDLFSFLFGNILLISSFEISILFFITLLVIFTVFILFRQFLAISFDEEFARTKNLKTNILYILLLSITALTIVILMRVVGLILVMALLTLPSAISTQFAKKISQMIIISIILSFIFINIGLYISFIFNLPSGAVIVLVLGVAYIFSIIIRKFLN